MPLRMLEVAVPSAELHRLPSLLEGHRLVDYSTFESTDSTGLVRILLRAHDTQSLTDLLVREYGAKDGFRVNLLPVEATVPELDTQSSAVAASAEEPRRGERGRPRISREELYEDIAQASTLTPVYVLMVALSTVVAAVGLVRGDTAIVIGAMVMAPLLGPNIALSLACTLGHTELAKHSLKSIGAGVTTAAVLSLLLGAVLTVDPTAPAIAARSEAAVGDIALALAAGTAGALAFTSGVSAVVVGVMVAVALLPPLVVAGLLVGAGHEARAVGALMLVLTNVTCINLAAMVTFFIRNVRPRTWWEVERANKAMRVAAATWLILLAVLFGLMSYVGVEAF